MDSVVKHMSLLTTADAEMPSTAQSDKADLCAREGLRLGRPSPRGPA
jgi:hypothetical protein